MSRAIFLSPLAHAWLVRDSFTFLRWSSRTNSETQICVPLGMSRLSHLSADPLLSDPSFRFTDSKLLTGEVFLAVQYNGIVRVSLGRHHNGYSIQMPQPTQMVFDPKSDIV
jgi:hypothetical protein